MPAQAIIAGSVLACHAACKLEIPTVSLSGFSASARSVAASYKPPMLVTRVRLPACALSALRRVLTAQLVVAPHTARHAYSARERVHTQAPRHTLGRTPVDVQVRSKSVLRIEVCTGLLGFTASARSVAASYKPPMLVTQVRLPACASLRLVAPAGRWRAHRGDRCGEVLRPSDVATQLLWACRLKRSLPDRRWPAMPHADLRS